MNYIDVAGQLESVRQKHASGAIGVDFDYHIIGFAKVIGDISAGAARVVLFFIVAFFITAIFVYAYSQSLQLTVIPLVSSLVSDRIYPLRLKEGTVLPAIAWQRISAQRTYTHDAFVDTAPWVRARVQVACWSNTALGAI